MRSKRATVLPRYFGYGRGAWTSDQWSRYGGKVVVTTARDVTYVLDEILDNQTDLPIAAQATPSRSSPCSISWASSSRHASATSATSCSTGGIDRPPTDIWNRRWEASSGRSSILEHWDDMLRLAGSLKQGWVTASLYVGKLQSYPRQSNLTQALQKYGRLVKTIFILRYLDSEAFRRRINRQLNKSESLHAPRQFLFFANEGKVWRREDEDQRVQAGCLNLMTNIVVAWNTVQMAKVVEDLRVEGCRFPTRTSPTSLPPATGTSTPTAVLA